MFRVPGISFRSPTIRLLQIGLAALTAMSALPHGQAAAAGPAALVKDINQLPYSDAGSTPGSLFEMGGKLYFAAFDETNGRELWTTDGTEAGTVLVKDISPGNSGSS